MSVCAHVSFIADGPPRRSGHKMCRIDIDLTLAIEGGGSKHTRDTGRAARARRRLAALAVALGVLGMAAAIATHPAAAAGNPDQRGPDPSVASVAATYGPFATAQLTVPAGNGF